MWLSRAAFIPESHDVASAPNLATPAHWWRELVLQGLVSVLALFLRFPSFYLGGRPGM